MPRMKYTPKGQSFIIAQISKLHQNNQSKCSVFTPVQVWHPLPLYWTCNRQTTEYIYFRASKAHETSVMRNRRTCRRIRRSERRVAVAGAKVVATSRRHEVAVHLTRNLSLFCATNVTSSAIVCWQIWQVRLTTTGDRSQNSYSCTPTPTWVACFYQMPARKRPYPQEPW